MLDLLDIYVVTRHKTYKITDGYTNIAEVTSIKETAYLLISAIIKDNLPLITVIASEEDKRVSVLSFDSPVTLTLSHSPSMFERTLLNQKRLFIAGGLFTKTTVCRSQIIHIRQTPSCIQVLDTQRAEPEILSIKPLLL